jgi:SPP1 gp7 family putative phage head morphogenesis protein
MIQIIYLMMKQMKIDIKEIAKNNGKKGSIEIPQQPLPKIEAVQYFKELNKLTKAMRSDIREQLIPALKSLNSEYATDSYSDTLSQIIESLSSKYDSVVGLLAKSSAGKMVGSIFTKNQKAFNKNMEKTIGVDISNVLADPGLDAFLTAQVNKNTSLIKSIPSEYFKSIETVVMNGVANGQRWEQIAKEIGGIKDISSVNGKLQNRIKLIARNETSNINASINKRRQEQLGVDSFKWQTAQDERVRESHARIDGNVYRWDDLPTVDGVKTSPGQPINCRCVAVPVIEV